jgi:hypothetical protein
MCSRIEGDQKVTPAIVIQPTPTEGSKSFFSTSPASSWNFYNYFSSTHDDLKKSEQLQKNPIRLQNRS